MRSISLIGLIWHARIEGLRRRREVMFNRWEAVGVWTASKACLFAYFRLPFDILQVKDQVCQVYSEPPYV